MKPEVWVLRWFGWPNLHEYFAGPICMSKKQNKAIKFASKADAIDAVSACLLFAATDDSTNGWKPVRLTRKK